MEVANSDGLLPALLLDHRIRATGFCQSTYTSDGRNFSAFYWFQAGRKLKKPDRPRALAENIETNAAGLSELVNAAEVHRSSARKRNGVIRSNCGASSHRFSRNITHSPSRIPPAGFTSLISRKTFPQLPRVGDFFEIEGVTDPSLFAPGC